MNEEQAFEEAGIPSPGITAEQHNRAVFAKGWRAAVARSCQECSDEDSWLHVLCGDCLLNKFRQWVVETDDRDKTAQLHITDIVRRIRERLTDEAHVDFKPSEESIDMWITRVLNDIEKEAAAGGDSEEPTQSIIHECAQYLIEQSNALAGTSNVEGKHLSARCMDAVALLGEIDRLSGLRRPLRADSKEGGGDE